MTWSIVAVDPETREVAVGAATCTVGVEMVRGIVPGVGVFSAQAYSNLYSRNQAVEALASGESLEDAFAAAETAAGQHGLSEWSFQQFAGAVLDPEPRVLAHTGSDTDSWAGSRQAGRVSVQGNMIRGPEVLDVALAAFLSPEDSPDLAERMMRGLEAGGEAGGDNRCPFECPAMTAFLAVARPEDRDPEELSLFLVAPRAYTIEEAIAAAPNPPTPDPDDTSPVTTLRTMFDAARSSELSR
jgi:uncharacterized Ntn-hydrolase superfamily protein